MTLHAAQVRFGTLGRRGGGEAPRRNSQSNFGQREGSEVGASVAVGEAVGVIEGLDVGRLVGCCVGCCVGAEVATHSQAPALSGNC